MNESTKIVKLVVGVGAHECGEFHCIKGTNHAVDGYTHSGEAYLYEVKVFDTGTLEYAFSEERINQEIKELQKAGWICDTHGSMNDSDEDPYLVCYNPKNLIKVPHHFDVQSVTLAVKEGQTLNIDYNPGPELWSWLNNHNHPLILEMAEWSADERTAGWSYRADEQ